MGTNTAALVLTVSTLGPGVEESKLRAVEKSESEPSRGPESEPSNGRNGERSGSERVASIRIFEAGSDSDASRATEKRRS